MTIREQRYAVCVAYGFEEAQRAVTAYLDGCFTNGKEEG